MKNKEIEELLNKLEYASECDDFIIEIRKDRAKLLLSYIEQLEKENKKYKDLGFEHLCKRNEQLEIENQQLKKQKDDVVELIKARIKENEGHINARMEIYHYKNMLRMLGEIE